MTRFQFLNTRGLVRNGYRTLGTLVALVTWLLGNSAAWAGKPVVVVASQAELHSGDKIVGHAQEGQLLEVIEAKGPWLMVELDGSEEPVRGYVLDRDVKAYEYHERDEVVMIEFAQVKHLNWYDAQLWPGSALVVMRSRGRQVLLGEQPTGGDMFQQLQGPQELDWVDASKVLLGPLARAHFDRKVRDASKAKPKDDVALAAAYSDRAGFHYTLAQRTNTGGWEVDKQAVKEREQWVQRTLDDFDRSREFSPNNWYVHMMTGFILQEEKQKVDDALACYTEAIRLNPKDSRSYNNRGNIWAGKGEYSKAIDDYLAAVRAYPKNVGAYCNLQNQHQQFWSFRKREDMDDEAKAVDQKFKDALEQLGRHFRDDPSLRQRRNTLGF